jgi:serine/threonine-protein kinase
MMHVREQVPDVRRLRPDVSAALAAVLDRATAKELSERYSDDAEMIAELERTLALETSRAGEADSQVTAVIDTLPRETRRQVPLSIRRPIVAYAVALVALLVIAGAVVVLALNGHGGPGHKGTHTGTRAGATAVALCSTCAEAYNPYAQGSKWQENNIAKYAVDGDPSTAWTTENYYGGSLAGKPGVGIYVTAAGSPAATRMVVATVTGGFDAKVYATNTTPDPNSFSASGWRLAGSVSGVGATQAIPLRTGGRHYRYYLFWITSLPPDSQHISVNEIKLYR